ncbi:MAG: SDR family oxidoreductase [Candidatus Muiribacteriota bacterium]
MKNLVITGARGLLGQTIIKKITGHYSVFEVDLPDIDITKRSFLNILDEVRPDILINCAAMTSVDNCDLFKEDAFEVNSQAVAKMAEFCGEINAHFIHYSTDYIFDGKKGPYSINDIPNPVNYYGLSKLISEVEMLKRNNLSSSLIRTNVVYGGAGRADFLNWLYKQLKEEKLVRIVDDQYSNPCFVEDLADFTIFLMENNFKGVFHSGSQDYLSRYEFACSFAETMGFSKKLILPVKTSELNQKAARPLKGGLDISETQSRTNFTFKKTFQCFDILKKGINE